ncbi:MAG: hypothetical protein D3922_09115, partial [Candidatus Electrothrix sp. AR1]|nr:hypothetical protein [Candidatus Electrothrix sp. AR1]
MTFNCVMQDCKETWKAIIDATRKIQDHAFNASSRKELLQDLLESKLPISKEDISVVYKSNGSESPRFVVSCGEEVYSKQHTDRQDPFPVNSQSIMESLEGDEEYLYFSTEDECEQAGFTGYKSVLCIPMHLSLKKNTGVFIAHSKTTEKAYENFIIPLDILSDSLTFHMKSNAVHHRDVEINELYNKILKDTSFDEIKILASISSELKNWFPDDDIYIFLSNSFDLDQYFLAADKSGVDLLFRTKKDSKKILPVAGNTLPLMIKEAKKKTKNTQPQDRK